MEVGLVAGCQALKANLLRAGVFLKEPAVFAPHMLMKGWSE